MGLTFFLGANRVALIAQRWYNVCNTLMFQTPNEIPRSLFDHRRRLFAQTDALAAAIEAARRRVGDDIWKRGYSGSDPAGATVAANWELKEAGISALEFEGELIHVGFVENQDNSGNIYPKLRVGVQNLDDQFLLSLDLKGDVAQRLVVKLDNCEFGDYVRISAWPTFVERGGRKYVNHAASIKGGDGQEVPRTPLFLPR